MPNWMSNALEYALDFSNILNASISASWLILIVIALRLIMKKVPKWVNVALWGIVALRLLMPFSIESAFSLIPSAQTVSDQLLQAEAMAGQQSAYLDIVTNPAYGGSVSVELDTTISAFQWELVDVTFLWLVGMAVLVLYTVVTYWRLRRKVDTAVILRDNIFQSERVTSPFVLGILRPRIYLPFQMRGQDLAYVIAHEQAHIRRKDHWWKPLGFLLLTIHWFNPLMWVAYILLCRDIELACDEKVISELDSIQRADYSQALVSCSVSRRSIAACPLAFGEVGVKERVRSIMNYRKPAFWIIVTAMIVCTAVAVCFLTDPKPAQIFTISGDVHRVVISHQSQNGEESSTTIADETVISKILALLESVEIEDYSRPLSPERMVLTFFNGNGDQQKWTVSYYADDDEIVTCGEVFGLGNKRVIGEFDYRWLLSLCDQTEMEFSGNLNLGLNAEIIDIDFDHRTLYVKDLNPSAGVFGDRCAIDCTYAISRYNLMYVNYGDQNDVRTIDFSVFEVGDAIIIGMYDSESENAFNGSAVAEQIQLATQRLDTEEKAILQAKLLYIEDEHFIVEPIEGSPELDSASRIMVPMRNMEPSPEPVVGDILQIEYDGKLQEVYPARIANVYHISVAEQAAPIKMVPTDTKLEGLAAGALLVPMNDQTYRYLLTDSSPENATAEELLYRFQEIDMGEQVLNEVYSLKEYPDRSKVLLISGKNGPWLCEYSPPQRCSDTALADAIEAGYVVMEDGIATHGQEIWQEFYKQTQKGNEVSVTVAQYHTLNPNQCDSVYYEIFKQDYPCLYVHELRYDGKQFTLSIGAEETRTYEYLMKYEDGPNYAFSSVVPQYRYQYVLTHDNRYTYNQLWMSIASSQAGAYIDHYTIYSEPKQ